MDLARLIAWLRRPRSRPLDAMQIVVITRKNCHLCDVAWKQLSAAQRRYGFALTAQDVDGHADLVQRFGNCVPVVTVNGKVRFRGCVNPVLFERLLRAELQNQHRRSN